MKLLLTYLLLSLLLVACSNEHTNQVAVPKTINYSPLDSLTKAFLAHAHDSTEIYSDTLVSQLTHSLRKQRVDTIIYFRNGCSGCVILSDKETSCYCNTSEEQSWLFWQYRGLTFAKKLDCCRNYPVMAVSPAAFAFYFQSQNVFAEERKFYQDFRQYNKMHPHKPHFLPVGPIHDLDVTEISLHLPFHQDTVNVWGGTYDSLGNPLFMKYKWRRKSWQWAKLLDSLTTKLYRP